MYHVKIIVSLSTYIFSMTAIKGLKGESRSTDVVTLGSAHPVCVATGDRGKPLRFLEAQEWKDPQFCPSLPPAEVSGLGKQEIPFSSLSQISYLSCFVGVPRMALLTRG